MAAMEVRVCAGKMEGWSSQANIQPAKEQGRGS